MDNIKYRKVSVHDADRLMNWAEENDIDYTIWNAGEVFKAAQFDCEIPVELGLAEWPDWYLKERG